MPDPSRLALFVGAALLLLVVPGPSVLYIVTQSVSHGRRAGIVSVAGITTGTLVHIIAATVGLSALLASSALAFDVVKYLGAAYLIAVGIRRLAGLGTRARAVDRSAAKPRAPLPPGDRRQHLQSEDGALLPRVPAPVRRPLARRGVGADPRARPALRDARLPQRRRLGARRRDARRPPAAQPQLPEGAALRLRLGLRRPRRGRRADRAGQADLALRLRAVRARCSACFRSCSTRSPALQLDAAR